MSNEISINQEQAKFLVYKHTNKINGKVYIGVTSRASAEDRWKNGKGYRESQPRMYNAILKYGWDNFDHEIIKKDLAMDDALELEEQLIKEYDSSNKDKGYNMLLSSVKNHPQFTEESKQRMSDSRKKYFENMSDDEYNEYCERCQKVSRDPSYMLNVSNRMKDYYSNEDNIKLLSERVKENYRNKSEEEKEFFRQRCKESMSDPSVREKISNSVKSYYQNISTEKYDEWHQNLKISLSKSDTKKKMSESQIKYFNGLTNEEKEFRRMLVKESVNRTDVKEKIRRTKIMNNEMLTEEERQLKKQERSQRQKDLYIRDTGLRERVSNGVRKAYENTPGLKDRVIQATKDAMHRPDVVDKINNWKNSQVYADTKERISYDYKKQREELGDNALSWNEFQKIWHANNKGDR